MLHPGKTSTLENGYYAKKFRHVKAKFIKWYQKPSRSVGAQYY